ncbi:MAG: GNAT family N-acetyltransferase [Gordonia sp. (in: high G+C Gram-positive bacteria)]|nr:MAG: GNAT family N-acetyltransferase [Gordonia sp. (in: high G+C Gram-positive bacteria)]
MGTMTVMKRPVQIDGYAPTSRRLFAGGGFSVSLSTDPDDIVDAQRLRFEVFTTAPGFSEQIGDAATRRDADRFDAYCDHLLVRDEESGELVGCARLLPPLRAIEAGGWYSAGEFDLAELGPIASRTVEMGRAAVAVGQRNGTVTALMWAGVLRYVEESSNRYLMGCVSVPLSTPGAPRGAALRGIRDELRNRHRGDAQVFPHGGSVVDGVRLDDIEPPDRLVVPPLMRGYLRLGARVHGEPAIDSVFDCGDFLTLLDAEEADSRYRERLTDTVRRLSVAAG